MPYEVCYRALLSTSVVEATHTTAHDAVALRPHGSTALRRGPGYARSPPGQTFIPRTA